MPAAGFPKPGRTRGFRTDKAGAAMAPRHTGSSFLNPKSVALIGASSNPGKLTARPLTFMARHGFGGAIYPINPGATEIDGWPAFASIHDAPRVPDQAYIMLDAEPALAALAECGQAGVRCATLLADGFGEAGPEGQAREARLVAIAQEYDMLVVGPNSTGIVDTGNGFTCTTNAAFAADALPRGRFAVLSQSGSVIGTMLSRGAAVGLGFRCYVSLGNEACLGLGEVGQLLLDEPEIDGFVLFMETLRRPDAFRRFADTARERGKPILAYLVGRSEAGRHLAASHTGAMTGGSRAIEAFLDALGVIRVQTLEVLAELSNALALKHRIARRPHRVSLVTTTGGGGGMVYDRIGLGGSDLAPMSEATRLALADQGIDLKPGPIVDLTLAGTRYDTMKSVITQLARDDGIGLIVAVIGSSAQFNPELAVKPVVDAVAEAGEDTAPVVAVPIPHALDSLQQFNRGGVPAFRTPENAAEAVAALMARPIRTTIPDPAPPDAARRLLETLPDGTLNERDGAALLRAFGLDCVQSCVVRDAADLPEPLPFAGPYALKVLSSDIAHKSEAGGVRLGLATRDALAAAMDDMARRVAAHCPDASIEGYLVQPMISGLQEAIIGFSRDPVVGPLITVGLGGVLTEIYKDISVRPAPISVEGALLMLDDVKGFALLRGYRGAPRGDLEALAGVIAALSHCAGLPRVHEAEANPVAVNHAGQGVICLDALVRLKPLHPQSG
jgi:acyl-CoA synthetase (NDP forming)